VNKWNDHVLGEEYKKEVAKLYPISKQCVFELNQRTTTDQYKERKRDSKTRSTLFRRCIEATMRTSSAHQHQNQRTSSR
jgi:hypothetical protein